MNSNNIMPSPLIKEFEIQAPRGKALDIGAGNGDNAIFLSQQGFSVTAIDFKKETVESIRKRAQENHVDVVAIQQDMRDFDIEKNTYSFISAINSLNFQSEKNFNEMINKIKNGLKKDGICVISLFTVGDSTIEQLKSKALTEDGKSFKNNDGKQWYYLDKDELRNNFKKDFTILFYIETTINENGHLNSPDPHKHAIAIIVAKK